jgi:hypothetical protein
VRISATTEIVDSHSGVRDLFVCSICVQIVECWSPVGRLVRLNGATRALRLLETGICRADANIRGPCNLVNMVGYGAIADHGIDTSNLDHATAH